MRRATRLALCPALATSRRREVRVSSSAKRGTPFPLPPLHYPPPRSSVGEISLLTATRDPPPRLQSATRTATNEPWLRPHRADAPTFSICFRAQTVAERRRGRGSSFSPSWSRAPRVCARLPAADKGPSGLPGAGVERSLTCEEPECRTEDAVRPRQAEKRIPSPLRSAAGLKQWTGPQQRASSSGLAGAPSLRDPGAVAPARGYLPVGQRPGLQPNTVGGTPDFKEEAELMGRYCDGDAKAVPSPVPPASDLKILAYLVGLTSDRAPASERAPADLPEAAPGAQHLRARGEPGPLDSHHRSPRLSRMSCASARSSRVTPDQRPASCRTEPRATHRRHARGVGRGARRPRPHFPGRPRGTAAKPERGADPDQGTWAVAGRGRADHGEHARGPSSSGPTAPT